MFLQHLFDRELKAKRKNLWAAEKALGVAVDCAVKEGAPRNAIASRVSREQDIVEILREEYFSARTRKWIKKAESLDVPVPPMGKHDGVWEQAESSGLWFLTEKGFVHLRKDVRSEQRDMLEMKFKLATLIMGLIGTITGLVAVIAVAF